MPAVQEACINMQWEYPQVLWGLLTLPGFLLLFVVLWRQKQVFWQAWCRLPFVRQQSLLPAPRHYVLQTALFLCGLTLSIIGFASPLLSRTAWKPVWENVALVVLLDVSRSMEAPHEAQATHAPSRFENAKNGLLVFLATLPPGVKVSVVPFAENAIPITMGFSADHDEIRTKVRRLQRDFFYQQGTDLSTTLREGFYLADAFQRWQRDMQASAPPVVALILISDGDIAPDHDLHALLAERSDSVPVFVIGIGSAQPAYIPDPLSPLGYLTDLHGAAVTTILHEDTLRFIAAATGGSYYAFAQRGQLFIVLQEIVRTQGMRSQQAYASPYALRRVLFLGAFIALLAFWKLESR